MIVKKEFHHGNLKNDALEKGLQIIKENGYENVEIKNIAKACGVSSPSIYRHFQSKNDLMMALFVKYPNSSIAIFIAMKIWIKVKSKMLV